MENVMQQAIDDGIVVYDAFTQGFQCQPCQKMMTGKVSVSQHLNNKKHDETCARYAINNIQDAHQSLLKLIPPFVKTAAQEGVIKVSEASGIPGLCCTVCDKFITGMVPAEQHLTGGDHRKKLNVRQISTQILPPTAMTGISTKTLGNGKLVDLTHTYKAGQAHTNKVSSTTTKVLPTVNRVNSISEDLRIQRNEFPQIIQHRNNTSSPLSNLNTLTQRALNEKVLIYDAAAMSYKCLVCRSTVSGNSLELENHLKSKFHMEEGARYAVIHPINAPQSLFEYLPQGAKEAAKAGVLVVASSGSYQCRDCHKFFTGLAPLKGHLVSNDHFKRTGNQFQQKIISQTPQFHNRLPDILNTSAPTNNDDMDDLARAFKEGVAIYSDNSIDQITCKLCHISLHGERNLDDHLKGKLHKKQIQKRTEYAPPDIQNTEKQSSLSNYSEESAKAFEDGTVTFTDNSSEQIMCSICHITLNGRRNLEDHLKGQKHKKQVQKHAESAPLDVLKPGDPVISNNTTEITHRAKTPYTVRSKPPGHVHVFNYIFQGSIKKPKERNGAKHDSNNLMMTFTNMGYKVFCHEDLDYKDTEIELKKMQKDETLQHVDVLIIFILSHGNDPYIFFTNDGKLFDLREMWKKFTDTECPFMKNKPKIFFTNYCRGPNEELPENDAIIDVPRDMVTIHASTEGITALRNPKCGTHFVFALCQILDNHAKKFELREIYNELDYVVKENKGRQPKWEDSRFKKFYFNPTL